MTLELVVDGTKMTPAVLSREERVSPHTGRSLAVLEVQSRIVVDGSTRGDLTSALEEGKALVESADGRHFKVASSSYSYSDNSPVTTFTLRLEETENIMATSILVGDSLSLRPERYREFYDHGAIIIEMFTNTTADDTEALEAAITSQIAGVYFPVVREGVQQEPLEMRFARCLWEQAENGDRRHFVTLVERAYDQNRGETSAFQGFNEPQLSRALQAIVSLQAMVEGLTKSMIEAELMSSAEAERLKAETASLSRAQFRQFNRAEKLEDYWLSR